MVQQIISFTPAAHVELGPVRDPKTLVSTDEGVAKVAMDTAKAAAGLVPTHRKARVEKAVKNKKNRKKKTKKNGRYPKGKKE